MTANRFDLTTRWEEGRGFKSRGADLKARQRESLCGFVVFESDRLPRAPAAYSTADEPPPALVSVLVSVDVGIGRHRGRERAADRGVCPMRIPMSCRQPKAVGPAWKACIRHKRIAGSNPAPSVRERRSHASTV